ncbi:MAG: glutathione S-transferase family protein [Alphaproteobacteria bacterium]
MKLYGSLASPYVARCWLTVAAKGGGADLEAYEGGIKSDSYLAMNPMGKMPLLVDGGTSIPESGVICEYLDRTLSGPALMPADAAGQAHVRLLCRIADLYVYPPAVSLLRLQKDGDTEAILTGKTNTVAALDYVEHFLPDTGFAFGSSLTLADVTLHGAIGLAVLVLGNHGMSGRFDGRPKLAKWWGAINENPTLKPALDQIQQTVTEFRQKREAEAAAKKAGG